MKCLAAIAVIALTATFVFGQQPTPTIPGSPNGATQRIFFYSAGKIQYTCEADSWQSQSTVTVSAATNANPVVFTATAHGFYYSATSTAKPTIFISGGTGNWTAVNGTFIATPTSANAFSIAVDSTSLGALTGTLIVTTRAPRLAQSVWRVAYFQYDASGNTEWIGWAANSSTTTLAALGGGTSAQNFACGSRATLSYQ